MEIKDEKYLEELKFRLEIYEKIVTNMPEISIKWLKKYILHISDAEQLRESRLQKLNEINERNNNR